ncbi:metallophosphoesterase [Dietzia sp.]|uniref:metallophosphoesterase n=1 Tax=Dietzia sp. TaxID=1871616 RepID=UPI002FDB1C12
MARERRGNASTITPPQALLQAGVAAAATGLVYGTLYERNNYHVRRVELPLLPPGTSPVSILHVSDLHMLPHQRAKIAFLTRLGRLDPDFVINTGDNLSSDKAVPTVARALSPLLAKPGAFVFGSNDYFAPIPKNPLSYLGLGKKRHSEIPLPWRDLRAAFTEHGWEDATHRKLSFSLNGARILVAGVDDPHMGADDYSSIAGPAGPGFDVRIGLTHSPEPRVLDAFDADGYDLALAGHTHGGQVCLPTGAIVTNCGIDRSRVKGVSAWGRNLTLHVSAGIGNSPYVPVRTFCRPEASLIVLTPQKSRGHRAPASPLPSSAREPLSVG